MADTVTLYNPTTGTVRNFGQRQARVKRRQGWTDPTDTANVAATDPAPRAPAIAASTIDEVMRWVDDDPDRAEEALQLEESRPDGPRKTLVDKLTPLAIRPPTHQPDREPEGWARPDTDEHEE